MAIWGAVHTPGRSLPHLRAHRLGVHIQPAAVQGRSQFCNPCGPVRDIPAVEKFVGDGPLQHDAQPLHVGALCHQPLPCSRHGACELLPQTPTQPHHLFHQPALRLPQQTLPAAQPRLGRLAHQGVQAVAPARQPQHAQLLQVVQRGWLAGCRAAAAHQACREAVPHRQACQHVELAVLQVLGQKVAHLGHQLQDGPSRPSRPVLAAARHTDASASNALQGRGWRTGCCVQGACPSLKHQH